LQSFALSYTEIKETFTMGDNEQSSHQKKDGPQRQMK